VFWPAVGKHARSGRSLPPTQTCAQPPSPLPQLLPQGTNAICEAELAAKDYTCPDADAWVNNAPMEGKASISEMIERFQSATRAGRLSGPDRHIERLRADDQKK